MEKIAWAIRIAPDQEDDFRATVAAFREAFDDFAATRPELGLAAVDAWAQRDPAGTFLIVWAEGDLATYFRQIGSSSGVDAWMKEKLEQWSGGSVDHLYRYPQSEHLFSWASET